jgi:hypothetical protein
MMEVAKEEDNRFHRGKKISYSDVRDFYFAMIVDPMNFFPARLRI